MQVQLRVEGSFRGLSYWCVFVVCQDCEAVVRAEGDLEIVVGESEKKAITTHLDPIYLSIFAHR